MTDPSRCRVCARTVRLRSDETAGRHVNAHGRVCIGTGLPPAGEPPCTVTCRRAGTVGWPPEGPVANQPHASTVVCADPGHQEEARAWVYGITGHAGVFAPFIGARREAAR